MKRHLDSVRHRNTVQSNSQSQKLDQIIRKWDDFVDDKDKQAILQTLCAVTKNSAKLDAIYAKVTNG